MLMYSALVRTIPLASLSIAIMFNWFVMVLIPASALSQTQKQCKSYGIMSMMWILMKLVKQKTLSTSTRVIFFFWDIQTYNHTRFYSQVLELQCKVPCEGKPIMCLHGEVHSCFSYYFWLLHFILLPGSICVWTKLLYWVFWVEKDRKRQAPLPGNSKKHKWRFTFQTYGWWCLTWFQSYIDFKMLLDCSSKGGLEILLWVKNIFCAMYHCQHKKKFT